MLHHKKCQIKKLQKRGRTGHYGNAAIAPRLLQSFVWNTAEVF
jgi:hypothetical protein